MDNPLIVVLAIVAFVLVALKTLAGRKRRRDELASVERSSRPPADVTIADLLSDMRALRDSERVRRQSPSQLTPQWAERNREQRLRLGEQLQEQWGIPCPPYDDDRHWYQFLVALEAALDRHDLERARTIWKTTPEDE